MKIKTGLAAILPILIGAYSLDASAVGKSFDFTAGSPLGGRWDLTLSGDQGFYHVPIFDEAFDPTSNFVAANSNVTGQFSYNTNTIAESTSDRSSFYYENTFFSIDLRPEAGGDSMRFDAVDPYTTVQNHPTNQVFAVVGNGINPPVTLNGFNLNDFNPDLDDGPALETVINPNVMFTADLPVDRMREDHPELFNNVNHVSVNVSDFGVSTYGLSSFDFSLYPEPGGGLPTDNSLPDHLPAIGDVRSSSFNIDFQGEGGAFVEVASIEGNNIDEDQENQIRDFVSQFYPELEASVQYDITDVTELPEGATANNPILPNAQAPEEGFGFTFEVGDDSFVFIDPEVAVGYDYEVLDGPNFQAVFLPVGIGDNLYDLFLFDEVLGEFVDSEEDLTGGVAHSFGIDGLNLFRIMGIEAEEGLDPDDPFAFVTGLSFVDIGGVNMTQTPITQTVVPVPPSAVLFMTGVAGLFFRSRKKSS